MVQESYGKPVGIKLRTIVRKDLYRTHSIEYLFVNRQLDPLLKNEGLLQVGRRGFFPIRGVGLCPSHIIVPFHIICKLGALKGWKPIVKHVIMGIDQSGIDSESGAVYEDTAIINRRIGFVNPFYTVPYYGKGRVGA